MDAIIAPIVGGRDEWTRQNRVDPLRAGVRQSVSLVATAPQGRARRGPDEDEDLLGGDLIDQSVTAEEDLSDSLVLELGDHAATVGELGQGVGRLERFSNEPAGIAALSRAMYSAVALRSSSAASVQPTRRATWPSVAWPRPGQHAPGFSIAQAAFDLLADVDVVLDVFK